jgi:hypothetical protein
VLGYPAERPVGSGLAGLVAGLPGQFEAASQVRAGLVVVGEPGAGRGQQAARDGLPGRVAEPGGGGQRRALGGGIVAPVPVAVKRFSHGPGQLPGIDVEAGLVGQAGHGEQDRALGGEPVHRAGRVFGLLGDNAGLRRGRGDGLA